MAVPFRRLVLWGVILGIPASIWLAKDGGPSPEFMRKLGWEVRAFALIAVAIEVYKAFKARP